MIKKDLKLAVIALEESDRRFYHEMLAERSNVASDIYPTLDYFKNRCNEKEYSGIIVDNRTLIRSSMDDREFFSLLCEGFPVMRISVNPDRVSVSCLIEGKQLVEKKGKILLDYFLGTECKKSEAHRVRLDNRRNIFLNAVVHASESGEPLKTNLWDISAHGCFVLTTNSRKKKGEKILLSINDLQDKTPVVGEIMWGQFWGTDFSKLPGYGLSFTEISADQMEEIESMIRVN